MNHKIAAIADIHWGASTILTSSMKNNLEKYFVDKLKTEKPDIIVIAGDYWHLKLPLTSTEAQVGNDFMHHLKSVFPTTYILILQGTRSHDYNQLDMFKPLQDKYFRIYDTVSVDYIEDLKLLFIPEEYYPDKSVYDQYIKNQPAKYDWIFFHGLFSFAGAYATQEGSRYNKICFNVSDFDNCVYGRITGGHIHDPVSSGNVDYCGSFDRWKHGEDMSKGYYLYEYNSETKKVLSRKFILNDGASQYITISYKKLPCKDLDKLVDVLSKESSGLTSLRIKICKEDDISDDEVQNLVAASMKFNNVVLYKEPKITSVEVTVEQQKEIDDRKQRLAGYKNLTFNQISTKFAKEEYNVDFGDKDIELAMSD